MRGFSLFSHTGPDHSWRTSTLASQSTRNRRITRKRGLSVAILASVTMLGVTGCQSGNESSNDAEKSASDSASSKGDQSGDYPVTLKNCGRDLEIKQKPERVVALNQGVTEELLSMGFGDRVVGTATWTDPILDNLKAQNDKIKRLSDNNASMETVLDQNPDFVAATFAQTLADSGSGSYESYKKVGVPAYLDHTECTKSDKPGDNGDGGRKEKLRMSDIYTDIHDLAEIMGDKAAGDGLQKKLEDRIANLSSSSKDIPSGTSIAFWFANSESPYMAGGKGAPQIIADQLGLKNVFEDNSEEWPQIGWEAIAAKDPDYLVVGDLTRKQQTAETAKEKIKFLKNNPVTKNMKAVKNDHLIVVAGGDLNPGIRTVDGMEKVAHAFADGNKNDGQGSSEDNSPSEQGNKEE